MKYIVTIVHIDNNISEKSNTLGKLKDSSKE